MQIFMKLNKRADRKPMAFVYLVEEGLSVEEDVLQFG